MITLRRGNRLPTVAVLQSYLNQHGFSDEYILVDGIFGRQTQAAVAAFERGRHMSVNGVVRGEDWHRIVGRDWQVIDSVDLTDFADPRREIRDDEDLAPYGETIVRNYGMTNGTPAMIQQVSQRSRPGRVVLLRMHGHGSPGNMVVSSGVNGNAASSFNSRYGPGFYRALRDNLRHVFCPFGSVEMHGCRVAAGGSGRALLRGMADALGVPVSAAVRSQLGGGNSTFRFEGPTVTICPGGVSLADWSRAHCQQSRSAGAA